MAEVRPHVTLTSRKRKILIAFAYNGKSFAISIPVFFSLFPSCCSVPVARIGNMPSNFKPCLLEMHNTGELKQEDLESFPSATKNIFPLPQCLSTPNLAGWLVTYHEGLPLIKS